GQQLEGAQQLGASLQNLRAVWPAQFHQDLRALPLPVVGELRIHGDAVFQLEAAGGQQLLQHVIDLVGSGYFIGKRHRGEIEPSTLPKNREVRSKKDKKARSTKREGRIKKPRPVWVLLCTSYLVLLTFGGMDGLSK